MASMAKVFENLTSLMLIFGEMLIGLKHDSYFSEPMLMVAEIGLAFFKLELLVNIRCHF